MSKAESTVIGAALAVACPLLTTVAFWWTCAIVSMYVVPVPEGVIKGAALTGLATGILADLMFLRRWVAIVYTASWFWVVAVYLGLSTIAFAFCMGVPFGIFLVGITGGVYLGRRLRHGNAEGRGVSRTLNTGALLAGAWTTLLALPIGLLALRESVVLRAAEALGVEARTASGPVGQVFMVMVCAVLFVLQFCATRAAGMLAFGHSRPAVRAAAPPAPSSSNEYRYD